MRIAWVQSHVEASLFGLDLKADGMPLCAKYIAMSFFKCHLSTFISIFRGKCAIFVMTSGRKILDIHFT